MLRYRATVVQAFGDLDRLTVNESVLSTRDVLALLHTWGRIERDAALQEALRAIAERFRVRELLSAWAPQCGLVSRCTASPERPCPPGSEQCSRSGRG